MCKIINTIHLGFNILSSKLFPCRCLTFVRRRSTSPPIATRLSWQRCWSGTVPTPPPPTGWKPPDVAVPHTPILIPTWSWSRCMRLSKTTTSAWSNCCCTPPLTDPIAFLRHFKTSFSAPVMRRSHTWVNGCCTNTPRCSHTFSATRAPCKSRVGGWSERHSVGDYLRGLESCRSRRSWRILFCWRMSWDPSVSIPAA